MGWPLRSPLSGATGSRRAFPWPWRDTPEGTSLPACLYIYPDPVHSLRGGCYQLAEAHVIHYSFKALAPSGQPPGTGRLCREPIGARALSHGSPPWLVLPACEFTLHIYSAHLLCFTLLLAHLLYSTARCPRAHAFTCCHLPSTSDCPPLPRLEQRGERRGGGEGFPPHS